jgi:hypothetical protein
MYETPRRKREGLYVCSGRDTTADGKNQVLAVIDFMSSQTTVRNTQQILLDFRRELRLAERLHLQRTGATVDAVTNFDRWMQSHYRLVVERATDLVIGWAGVMASTWSSQVNTPQGAGVVHTITVLYQRAVTLRRNGITQT